MRTRGEHGQGHATPGSAARIPAQEDRELRSVLREGHAALDSSAPPFRSLWDEAVRRAPAARRRRTARRALAASLLLVAGLAGAWRLLGPAGSGPAGSDNPGVPPGLLRLAASLNTWQAPLDFLLHTPGEELLRDVPAFPGNPVLRLSPEITDSMDLSEPG